MAGDHDLGYKQLFAHPELVRDLLAGFTPFACFQGLDASAFERVSGSYVSEQLSERHDDMVWRVRLADDWLLAPMHNLVAALFRLELSDSSLVLVEVVATLRIWLDDDKQAPLRRSIGKWIDRLQQREFKGKMIPGVVSLLEGGAMGERYQRKYATWADALEDQGLRKGLARGREEGKLMALRIVLKRQLAKRFGELPAAMMSRIDEAREPEVERWIDRAWDVDSVEGVFAEPSGH